jgi:hypothetical protein
LHQTIKGRSEHPFRFFPDAANTQIVVVPLLCRTTPPQPSDFVPSTGRVHHSHCTQAQAPGNPQRDFSPSPNCYKNDLTTARPHHPSTSSIKIWVRTPVCPSLFWPKPRPILATGTSFLLLSGELVAMHRRLSPLAGILLIGVTATVHSWIDVQD